MVILRSVASETWTDHNLHDPGITLLESLCYALTEMGLRAGMDVSDLVASDISGHRQPFFTASEILPVAPVTGSDFRKILIDHPLVHNAWLRTRTTVPGGRSDVLLEFVDERLNSNTFNITVEPPPLADAYQIDIAFPWWDEEEVLPFSEDVEIQNIDIDFPPGNQWRSISGGHTWYTRLNIGWQPEGGGPQNSLLWVIATINTTVEDPPAELQPILSELSAIVMETGDNSIDDQTLLKRFNRRVTDAHRDMRSVRRYLKDYRNLCENFSGYNAARPQEIAISANIEVEQSVQIENLLADIFLYIDRYIAPDNIFESLASLRAEQTVDRIYDGPLLDSGFLPEENMSRAAIPGVLYTSDILRVILQVRELTATDDSRLNIGAVSNLGLANYIDNRPITTNARECLRLVESRRHIPKLSVTKSYINLFRNGIKLEYDNERVIELFHEKREASQPETIGNQRDLALLPGDKYPVNEYYPAQNDLPLVYGVGEAGLPDTASEERKALTLQLKGYLFHFEQIIAGVASQLAHFNAFFSVDPDLEQTLFQQPLYHIPRAEYLLKSFDYNSLGSNSFLTDWETFTSDDGNGYNIVLNQSLETREQFLLRRNKVLDHLLANHGEEMRDRSTFTLGMANTVEERNLQLGQLIHEKSAFILDLPELNRLRAQSFGNPLFRRRELLQILTEGEGIGWIINDSEASSLLQSTAPLQSEIAAARESAAVITLATSEANYTIEEIAPGEHRLFVGTTAGTEPAAMSVSLFATLAEAETAIDTTIEDVMELWMRFAITPLEWRVCHMLGIEAKERKAPDPLPESDGGFYMVEHLLIAPDDDAGLNLEIEDFEDPYTFQVTFIFPSGYARDFSDEEAEKVEADAEDHRNREFRKYAETQIRKACPAHILPGIVWVDRSLEGAPESPDDPSFENFEERYLAWLEAWFTDGATGAEIEPLRNNLVEILNLIYQDR